MDESPLPTETEATAEATRSPRVFRFSLGTLMILVLMMATISGMSVRMNHLLKTTSNSLAIDAPALAVIAITITAIAIVSVRRGTLHQGMLQITVCCALVLVTVGLMEAEWTRALRYWFQACFALTVALPLLLRRFAVGNGGTDPRRAWVLWTSEVLLAAFANVVLVLLGILIQIILTEEL
ncbi:MAG: hypothetical protein P4L84_23085 [Isosphaeraceae bacterium]|nr:hypothetical protein [Isosphaeraceae bacterium]